MLGEAPISSLQNASGIAKQAQDALTNASRSLQTEGWSFNTDYETKLVRNSAKEIQAAVKGTGKFRMMKRKDHVAVYLDFADGDQLKAAMAKVKKIK